MHLQTENFQKEYARVVSSRDEASARILQLNKDMLVTKSRVEKGDQDVKLITTQCIKTQAKLDALETMGKDILENCRQNFANLHSAVGLLH